MDKHELSRRKLLAGLGTAGVGGGLLGTGTAAFFSDEAIFANNRFSAGALRLAVGNDANSDSDERIFEVDVDASDPGGSTTFPVTLPATDRQDNENNPAYVWFRTASCPDPNPTEFAESLEVSLSYACGNEEVIVETQDFACFKSRLRDGIRLDPECDAEAAEPRCLDPEDSVELQLDWDLDSDYEGDESATLTFEFVAEQCRHSDGTVNPFPDESCGKDISWVAFCADENIAAEDIDYEIDGPELTLRSGPDSINAVLLKSATTLYEFTGGTVPDSDSSGDDLIFTTSGCGDGPGGWDQMSYQQNGSEFEDTNRSNPSPCPGDCGMFKYNVDDGETKTKEDCDGGGQ